MPDRFIRTADGVLGGLLVIMGVIYVIIGWTWLVFPTSTRLEGVAWAPFDITLSHVGWWWIIGGLATAVCSALSRWRIAETIAVVVGTGTSGIVAALFVAVWAATGGPGALVASVTYGGWAAVVGWVSVRTALNQIRGEVTTTGGGDG